MSLKEFIKKSLEETGRVPVWKVEEIRKECCEAGESSVWLDVVVAEAVKEYEFEKEVKEYEFYEY